MLRNLQFLGAALHMWTSRYEECNRISVYCDHYRISRVHGIIGFFLNCRRGSQKRVMTIKDAHCAQGCSGTSCITLGAAVTVSISKTGCWHSEGSGIVQDFKGEPQTHPHLSPHKSEWG